MAKKTQNYLTPRRFAERNDVAYTTVMLWLSKGLLAGAFKQEMPAGGYVYQIPEDASAPDLKPGPKKGAKRTS